ncbi:MAG: thioredoxin family protein, partial [Phycisphaerae bacterium]|nr:thioredoxin family protein [Phycisphaerae bacterium]
ENNSKLLQTIASEPNDSLVMTIEAVDAQKLPRLLELGADKCIPCKMMKPILEELTQEYTGKLQVEFYDVWKDPAPGQKYGVRMIPTQIFLDPNGKELFRHEGFFSKEDILAAWKKFGFDFSKDK